MARAYSTNADIEHRWMHAEMLRREHPADIVLRI